MRSCSILAVLAFAMATTVNAEMKIVSQGKATQIMTDEYIVRSDKIDRDFIIEVTRPDGVPPNQKTAVVYATDGGFGLVGPISRTLAADGKIQQAHVVSIGYPNERGRHAGPRQIDLSHGRVELPERPVLNGGGDKFEAFILEEVRPFIESKYPVDPKRSVLVGHSMGGLFVANVMLGKPDSFSGYLIGGVPVVGQPSLLERAKAVAPKGQGRVFVGYCPSDAMKLRSNEFAGPLSGADSKFKVLERNFTEWRHNSEIPSLITEGLRFLLPTDGSEKTVVAVKPEVLDRYLGTYRTGANSSVTFSREDSRLFGTTNEGEKFEFFAESDTRFFARDVYARIEFETTQAGPVDRIKISINERDGVAARVK